ncbi:MAG TPA: hypothetical protein ENI77_12670 [Nitrospirae bacterium]|nr:hypothetical protein [Nitrospirota bacterium]
MRIPFYFFALALFLASAPAMAVEQAGSEGGIEEVFSKLSRDLQCLCGCNSTIASCPHVKCGYAVPARKKMRAMLNDGKTYDDVVAYFVKKEGEVALSSPTKKGFNLVGYILPFIAIIAAGSGVAVTASRWAEKGRQGAAPQSHPEPAPEMNDEMAEKLRKELKDFEA